MAKKKRESGGSGRRPVSKATKKDEKRKSKGKETSKKKKSTSSSSSESESSIDDAEVQMANAIGATFGLFLVCALYCCLCPLIWFPFFPGNGPWLLSL